MRMTFGAGADLDDHGGFRGSAPDIFVSFLFLPSSCLCIRSFPEGLAIRGSMFGEEWEEWEEWEDW